MHSSGKSVSYCFGFEEKMGVGWGWGSIWSFFLFFWIQAKPLLAKELKKYCYPYGAP